jgi:hypothetical protein
VKQEDAVYGMIFLQHGFYGCEFWFRKYTLDLLLISAFDHQHHPSIFLIIAQTPLKDLTYITIYDLLLGIYQLFFEHYFLFRKNIEPSFSAMYSKPISNKARAG